VRAAQHGGAVRARPGRARRLAAPRRPAEGREPARARHGRARGDHGRAERLFAVIRRLRDGGTTVVYVSRFLEEVLALAERVTVLKDGRVVQTTDAEGQTPDSLIAAILGRSLDL